MTGGKPVPFDMAGGHAPRAITSKRMDLVKAVYEHRQSKGHPDALLRAAITQFYAVVSKAHVDNCDPPRCRVGWLILGLTASLIARAFKIMPAINQKVRAHAVL
jgi:hypothetical protein